MPNETSIAGELRRMNLGLALLIAFIIGISSASASPSDVVYKIAASDMHDNVAASVSDQLPLLNAMGVKTIVFPTTIDGLALTVLREVALDHDISVIAQTDVTSIDNDQSQIGQFIRSILFDNKPLSGLAEMIDQRAALSDDQSGPLLSEILRRYPDEDPRQATKRLLFAHAVLLYMAGQPILYSGDMPSKPALEGMRQTAYDNPVFQLIAAQAKVRATEQALRSDKISIISKLSNHNVIAITRAADEAQFLLIFNRSGEQKNVSLDLPEKLKKPCLIDGVRGLFARREGVIAYAAPALSWAVYDLGGCRKRKKR